MSGIYGISVVNLEGNRVELSKYKGKVLLIVNVASRCGFTSQYKELQRIHKKYRDKELFVLGFPCNDFADQEPGSADDIREFCDRKYGVTFDLFERVTIRGSRSHLLYEYLEGQRLPVVRGNGLKAKLFPFAARIPRFHLRPTRLRWVACTAVFAGPFQLWFFELSLAIVYFVP